MTSTIICSYINPVWKSTSTIDGEAANFQFGSSTCEYQQPEVQLTISSSVFPSVSGGFTYGEVVNSVLLFLIFATTFYALIYFSVNFFKIKIRLK